MKRLLIMVMVLLGISTASVYSAQRDACQELAEHSLYWAENGAFGLDGDPVKAGLLKGMCPESKFPCEHLEIHKKYWEIMKRRFGKAEDMDRRAHLESLCKLASSASVALPQPLEPEITLIDPTIIDPLEPIVSEPEPMVSEKETSTETEPSEPVEVIEKQSVKEEASEKPDIFEIDDFDGFDDEDFDR